MKRSLFAIASFLFAAPLSAQVDVGYPPPQSPFRDLEFKHEITAFGGYYMAAKDPAGVAPRSAPMEGIRYELTVGGPVQFVARIARVNSERQVINPLEPRLKVWRRRSQMDRGSLENDAADVRIEPCRRQAWRRTDERDAPLGRGRGRQRHLIEHVCALDLRHDDSRRGRPSPDRHGLSAARKARTPATDAG